MPDTNSRYSGASAEISARIQSRNNLSIQFVTYASAVIGIAVSNQEWRLAGSAVGYIALGTALLMRSHNLFIAHLARFQQELTAHCADEKTIPDWNCKDKLVETKAARASHNVGQLFFLFVAVALSSTIALPRCIVMDWHLGFWSMGVTAGVTSLIVTYQTGVLRELIFDQDKPLGKR